MDLGVYASAPPICHPYSWWGICLERVSEWGLFILNVASSVLAINKNVCSSAYIAESLNLWHGRLGHVNVASIY